ncbi:UTP--glucose-1-phosphate uridylyltransferase GalU [Paenibacillus sp. y28]|uniref:UTP--glucose-1-phosphate uridylyltransferase GalU n=1 Tax=Paenibacillus sp. y28 TaxID=3129110 RepID=UPI0030190791
MKAGKVKKAIIPAAGLGTRFLPATKAVPKEMFPLLDKPAIQYIVEEAVDAGIESILIVTGKHKRAIEDHFDKNNELEWSLQEKQKEAALRTLQETNRFVNIHFVRQQELLGLGHAIHCGSPFVGGDPFAVLLGDIVTDAERPALKQLIACYEAEQSPVLSVKPVAWQEVSRYGVVSGPLLDRNMLEIRKLIEKPQFRPESNLAIMGRYILDPGIFNVLQQTGPGAGGEIQLTDALQVLSVQQRLLACIYDGPMYDVGDKLGYLKASIQLALKHEGLKEPLSEFLRDVLTEQDTDSAKEGE